jgi:hypothetical protein
MSINSYDGSTSALLKSPRRCKGDLVNRPTCNVGEEIVADPSTPLLTKISGAYSRGDWADIGVAYLNLVKAVVGAGVLALPYAFSHGGLVFSSLGMAVIALWNYFTVSLLLKCKSRCKVSVLQLRKDGIANSTFGALAYLAMGRAGTLIIDISLILTLLGIGVTYQIQAGTLLNSCGFLPSTATNQRIWTLVSLGSQCSN